MKNVVLFVGSRANYGRLISLIDALNKDQEINVYIIGACTLNKVKHNIGLDLYIHADMYDCDLPGNRANTIAMVSMATTQWLMSNKMDIAVVHGDRFECLGFAIAVNMNEVPLIHMEAGDITNIDNEVRWAISQLSQFHMCNCYDSYNRMRMESNKRYNPYNVGSTIVEYIQKGEFKHKELHHVLVLYNPVNENEFEEFIKVIGTLVKDYPDIIFKWVNPNIDPGNKKMVEKIKHVWQTHLNLDYIPNLELDDYIQSMADSIFMIGNTSSGIKEGYVLGVPYLMYGGRQGNREVFLNTMDFHCISSILETAREYLDQYRINGLSRFPYRGELGKGNTSKDVIDLIKSLKKLGE
jgi:UDP-hydrolysing UDP-N-acetyl-D-glucosamine 2-epimerase